jgi:hypothetical protein
MKRTYNGQIVVDEQGQLAGIALGADYCAEHEFGISSLQFAFGLQTDEKTWGIERRRVRQVPKGLVLLHQKKKKEQCAALVFERYCDENRAIPSTLVFYGDEELVCAWDESSFGVMVRQKDEKYLTEMIQAFRNHDVAIGLSGGHVFQNAGLSLMIISRLPKETLDTIYEADKDYYMLKKAAAKTGIEERLKKAGKRYFALSPRWADGTKKAVKFWLNPCDQHIYNSGWYSVQDLDNWIQNKGPIIKNRA